MKIIFLDIDGVLNSELTNYSKEYPDGPKGSSFIDENLVTILNNIIEKTGAKIVLSSSWRKSRTVEEMQELLEFKGFKGEIIGKTPILVFKSNIEGGYHNSVPRGCEIKAWLEISKEILGDKMSKVRYAILDDDSDMLYWQRESYFMIDRYCGLTRNVAFRVINHLNR